MRWVLALLLCTAVTLGGCYTASQSLIDGGPRPDSGRVVIERDATTPPPPPPPPTTPPTVVDILVVMDDSNSMTEEQASFTELLPYLVRVLATGDVGSDGTTDFEPMRSIRIGVVTTDMGVGGHLVPTCEQADFGDDGILQTQGRTDMFGCAAAYPIYADYDSGEEIEPFAQDVACVAAAGTGGCGFEQQLEAGLKALSPSGPTSWTAADYTPPYFHAETYGHGDGENGGFIRPDSLLMVVFVTDENDCSARDPEVFNPTSATYGDTDLNLRCWAHGDTALHPISRYVDGLIQLRSHPSRLMLVPIVGVPADLPPAPGGAIDWPRLVGPTDGTRDERMVERIDPTMGSRLTPSCNVPGRGVAFPPIRLLRVAEDVEARGATVVLESICQGSYLRVADAIGRALVR